MNKYERGYNKSCNVKRIKYNGKVYKINIDELKKFLRDATIVIAGVAMIIGLGDITVKRYDEFKEMQEMKKPYVQVLNDSTHRTNNIDEYWYDYDAIAKDMLKDSDSFDLKLYCIYDQIGYNDTSKKSCINELFQNLNFEISKEPSKYIDFEVYGSFEEYLISNGFVTENNVIDYEGYEDIMEARLKESVKEGEASWKK